MQHVYAYAEEMEHSPARNFEAPKLSKFSGGAWYILHSCIHACCGILSDRAHEDSLG